MKLKFLIILVYSLVLFLSVRGLPGNVDETSMGQPGWTDGGPFELSVERGRFALLYSLVENKSLSFSLSLARFATPDLGYVDNRYVSLFAPGVSYLAVPGYLLGKMAGASQVGTYLVISFFALFNGLLIYAIARKLTSSVPASFLAGLIFLFATPAFAYSVTLYQHHISTFLILASLYLLTLRPRFWPLFFVWFLCAASISIDYPNLFLMLPIGLYALLQIFRTSPKLLLSFVGIILPALFFLNYNQSANGGPLRLSGTVAQVPAIDDAGKPYAPEGTLDQKVRELENPGSSDKSTLGFFYTRDLIRGFNIHLFSPDRGVLFFTPVIFLGLLGIFFMSPKKFPLLQVLVGVAGFNIVLYSMWGDPWGGWAFGSRYLIPAYSILAIFLAVALTKYRKNLGMLLIFLLLTFISLGLNTLGALTSNKNPPQVEASALSQVSGRVELYTPARNWEFLNSSGTKSFAYVSYLYNYLTPVQFYYLLLGLLSLTSIICYFRLYRSHD